MSEPHVLDAVLREDLHSFIAQCFGTLNPGVRFLPNWHYRHIAYELQKPDARRVIISLPPRYGKSVAVTIAYSAWLLGRNPSLKVMAISYSEKLARQHARDFRAIVESDWFRRVFPAFQVAARTNLRVSTTAHGERIASSMDGTITGMGADVIIIDDPLKAQAALSRVQRERVNQTYDLAIYSRLNNKNTGRIIIVGHRLHELDLVGHVSSKERWTQVVIPAVEVEAKTYRLGRKAFQIYRRRVGEVLHSARENEAQIEIARSNMGSAAFSAQYQQAPLPDRGIVIDREWIRYYDTLPEEFDEIIASWDTASTIGEVSDYSVGTIWGLSGTNIYLVDLVRGRWGFPDLKRQVLALSDEHSVDATVIEATDTGRALAQELGRGHAIRPTLRRPIGEKAVRMAAQSARFEAGQVLLPPSARWLGAYIAELLSFPNGANDDQVDSTSQALAWMSHRIKLSRGEPGRRPMVRR